ncbi:MAG TPA: hypothetical protein VH573_03085 [Mycobacteriales bacterium]
MTARDTRTSRGSFAILLDGTVTLVLGTAELVLAAGDASAVVALIAPGAGAR